jgi:uncharacterized membrane protein YtjA (UPF0391 family)
LAWRVLVRKAAARRSADWPDRRRSTGPPEAKEEVMLGWSLTFLILALIAGLLGFAGLAGAAAGIAKILFYVFLILLVVSFLARAIRGQSPV